MAKKRVPQVPMTYDQAAFTRIMAEIEQRFARLEVGVSQYTITNRGADSRTIDWGAATDAQKLDFLVTIIADLIKAGKLGG